ncbi:glycosyl transferase [Aureococcus anophagefferens]|uniref:Glycosyl transferase n=1 Tax=Aureococcus anophagefferens TaxID=44056 RepID=A0ABR1G3N5_AURAN
MIAALSPMMPTTKFLCVATAWTNGVVQHILKRFENVDIQMGTQNAAALPFANLIHALMTDDAFYAAAAADARKSGLAFIEKHEDKMDAIIAEDPANPGL